jgi:hypothetical protein
MRRISDYPTIPALSPVRPVRRPESYEKEPRDREQAGDRAPGDNDSAAELADNRQGSPPGRLLDEFA